MFEVKITKFSSHKTKFYNYKNMTNDFASFKTNTGKFIYHFLNMLQKNVVKK